MDRLARNVDDLRQIVLSETRRGVRMQFIKENLNFTGDESPMANLMLSVLGAVAQFERDSIRECQREGIALAKQRGAYTGRKKARPAEDNRADVFPIPTPSRPDAMRSDPPSQPPSCEGCYEALPAR
jgi:DNA invertase Pin-like site-specific DNA recombinase